MFEVLDTVCQPTRATKYSAMVDLYAREDVVIGAGETKIVPLGVKIDIETLVRNWFAIADDRNINDIISDKSIGVGDAVHKFKQSHFLELHPRSSLRAKGLIIGVGVIDLDYPDELGLIVHNPLPKPAYYSDASGNINTLFPTNDFFTINKGDKIAQCTLKEHKGYLLGIESDVERSGGFGSTGM